MKRLLWLVIPLAVVGLVALRQAPEPDAAAKTRDVERAVGRWAYVYEPGHDRQADDPADGYAKINDDWFFMAWDPSEQWVSRGAAARAVTSTLPVAMEWSKLMTVVSVHQVPFQSRPHRGPHARQRVAGPAGSGDVRTGPGLDDAVSQPPELVTRHFSVEIGAVFGCEQASRVPAVHMHLPGRGKTTTQR